MGKKNSLISYEDKRSFLDSLFPRVAALDFYRELFPQGSFERSGEPSDKRPNGLITEILNTSHDSSSAHRYLVFDELAEIEQFIGSSRFALMAPIGYSGKRRNLKNAYTLYALTFDLDDPQIDNFFWQVRADMQPIPTYTILSGHGLHLYYQFETPQPLYPRNQLAFKLLKEKLTPQIWNMHTSSIPKPQYQGINQGFRIVGSASKLGKDYPVLAWRTGSPVTVEYLTSFLILEDDAQEIVRSAFAPASMSWQEAEDKYPDWAQRKKGDHPRQQWHVHRGLYDWWKTKVSLARYGHRYYYLMCLAIYARKCDVGKEELHKDMLSLINILNTMGPEPVTHNDINAAMNAYDDTYTTFTRDAISHLTAIPIPANKRNGRKQAQHLRIARATLAIMNEDLESNLQGRPAGSGTKREIVQQWRAEHPQGKKIECQRQTGLSRPTVLKWWDR